MQNRDVTSLTDPIQSMLRAVHKHMLKRSQILPKPTQAQDESQLPLTIKQSIVFR